MIRFLQSFLGFSLSGNGIFIQRRVIGDGFIPLLYKRFYSCHGFTFINVFLIFSRPLNTKIALMNKVKCHRNLINFRVHHNT